MTPQFDIAIIGGGITGLGVARAAADAGKSVLLLERDKICGATSAASLRIIHGGFRYLQQLDMQRILESVRAQIRLLSEYPEFIKPLQCYMPLRRSGLKSRYPVSAAAFLYRAIYQILSGENQARRARVVLKEEAEKSVSLLQGICPYGALSWQDAYIEDFDGLVNALVSELRRKNAQICEETEVRNVCFDAGAYQIKTPDETYSVKQVVNATGAEIQKQVSLKKSPEPQLKWARGYNIIISKKLVEDGRAVGIQSDAGRLYFLCPRGEGTALGTWYTPVLQVSTNPVVAESEIVEALKEIHELFPGADLNTKDVLSTEAGLLPMSEVHQGEVQLVRKEKVFAEDGFATLLSTKFTTFQLLGEKTIKRLSGKESL